jgi:hypothetical protein
MIVAWHEVPGTAPPLKSRPVGYGMIVQVCAPIRRLKEEISNAVSVSRIEMIPKMHRRRLRPCPSPCNPATCGISCTRSYRTLRDGSFEGRFPRHFVPGYDQPVPPGQNHSAHKGRIKLALIG